MNTELKQNVARIIRTLEGHGMKPTKIAHSIGYTTTTQLYNTIEGKSMISTKAVQGLIENLNINPIFLFLGKGDMFLSDESEIETLRRENREWIQKHNEALKTVKKFEEMIKTLERRNADLIDLTSAAKEYYKSQISEAPEPNANEEQEIRLDESK